MLIRTLQDIPVISTTCSCYIFASQRHAARTFIFYFAHIHTCWSPFLLLPTHRVVLSADTTRSSRLFVNTTILRTTPQIASKMMYAPMPRRTNVSAPQPPAPPPQRRPRYPDALPGGPTEPLMTEPANGLAIIDVLHHPSDRHQARELFPGLSEILEPADLEPSAATDVAECGSKQCQGYRRFIPCAVSRSTGKVVCVINSAFRSRRTCSESHNESTQEEEALARDRLLNGGYVILTDDFVAARPMTSLLGFISPDGASGELSQGADERREGGDRAGGLKVSDYISRAQRKERQLFQRRPSTEVYGSTDYQPRTLTNAECFIYCLAALFD